MKRCSRTSTTTTTTKNHLPGEIMFDIFSRLCIQDLSPCRFVCKYWHYTIRDPFFVNFHHSRVHQHDPTFVIIPYRDFKFDSQLFLVDNKTMSTELRAKHIPISLHSSPGSPYIVGSSNGLVCLWDVRSYYILNPITNEMVLLPRAPHYKNNIHLDYIALTPSGFALDATTNTYKLVQVTWCRSRGDWSRKPPTGFFDILTIGYRKWTRIHQVDDFFPVLKAPVLLNNALHWQILCNPDLSLGIGALDVGAGTFRAFKTPPKCTFDYLSSLKGCLCFFTESAYDYVHVWIMKEYGVESSWSKEYTVCVKTLLHPRDWRVHTTGFRTVTTMKNGNTLLAAGNHLIYCVFEKKEYHVVNIHQLPLVEYHGPESPIAHIGSLISPKTVVGAAGKEIKVRPRRKVKTPLT